MMSGSIGAVSGGGGSKPTANNPFNSTENKKRFHTAQKRIPEILNMPKKIDLEESNKIKDLYTDILNNQQGSGVNTRKAFKILSEQIATWINTTTDMDHSCLINTLLYLNANKMSPGKHPSHQKVFFGHVLTQQTKATLETLLKSYAEAAGKGTDTATDTAASAASITDLGLTPSSIVIPTAVIKHQDVSTPGRAATLRKSQMPPPVMQPYAAAAAAAHNTNSGLLPSSTGIPADFIDYIGDEKITKAEHTDRLAVMNIIRKAGGLNSANPFLFSRLKALTCLPEGFNPTGKVTIEGCKALTTLPKFTQAQEVTISLCESFTNLPEGFNFSRKLIILLCQKFSDLPEGFNPSGTVIIQDCPKLTGGFKWAQQTRRSFTPLRDKASKDRIVGFQSTPLPSKTGESVEI